VPYPINDLIKYGNNIEMDKLFIQESTLLKETLSIIPSGLDYSNS